MTNSDFIDEVDAIADCAANEAKQDLENFFSGANNFINSASDARVINNSDNVMRHAYRVLSDEEKALMVEIKDMGLAFYQKLEALGDSMELSTAKRKIREAVMWGVSHLTR